jgi:hypothetical protein
MTQRVKRIFRIPEEFEWAWDIIERERLAEEIGQEIVRGIKPAFPPVPLPLRMPKVNAFGKGTANPHQVVTVPAGETKRVFYLKIPEKAVGFLKYVGNTYFLNDYLYWYVDYEPVIDPYIERVLGTINSPLPIVPWRQVDSVIEWKAENNDTVEHTYEILCDGVWVPEEDVDILLRLGMPVGK